MNPETPTVPIYQWEGRSATQTISDTEPAWLHDGRRSAVTLGIRVFSAGQAAFSFTQPASYSAEVKDQILRAVLFNKKSN